MPFSNAIDAQFGNLALAARTQERAPTPAKLAAPVVLHVCDKLSIRGSGLHGVGRLLEWWFPELSARGFDPRVLVMQGRDLGGEHLERHGIPVTYLGRSRLDLRTLPEVWHFLGQLKPALVHLHGYGPWTFGRVAARLRGIPIVLEEHMIAERSSLPQRAIDWLLAGSDPTIAVSDSVAQFCYERRGIRRNMLRTIMNGLPLAAFRPTPAEPVAALRRELGLEACHPIIGSVGRLEPRKGYADMLRAIPEIRRRHPDLGVVIAGDGEARADLEALASELGIADCLRLPGFRHDVPALLTLMNVFVLPSHSEGMSLAMLEALAVGRPMVATRVGGLPEVLSHEQTALLVPPGEPAAITASVLRLLSDPALAHRLADAGQTVAREKHDIRASVREMVAVYAELLAGRS